MTFRTRLAAALSAGALIPLVIFGVGVRRAMTARLDRQATRRVEALVGVVRAGLAGEVRDTRGRLRELARRLESDNRFRLAIDEPAGDRRWLLDWAPEAMSGAGLSVLQIQDSAGRILSSGQFRNDFDRIDAGLVRVVVGARETGAIARVRLANGAVQAFVEVDSLAVGGRRFTILGGRATDSLRLGGLPSDGDVAVALMTGDSVAGRVAVAAIELPFVDETAAESAGVARFVVTRDLEPLRALRRDLDVWLVIALGATLALAIVLAAWLAGLLSRPIDELAEKTSRLDLDRLDQRFATGRDDEIGVLANVLDSMTSRLRSGAAQLRASERRATVGDLARQINHDIKNGLTPIRHVVRHLTEVAERDPAELAAVYGERRETLESSVEYLDGLARNYANLSPSLDRTASDPNAILGEIARANGAPNVTVELTLAEPVGRARVEPLVLRRILENLVGNAVDALEGRPGRIVLASRSVGEGDTRRVRLTVTDSGRGMRPEELDRAFDDFYTTKTGGTGLGLSVVRRLVGDLGGTLKVETAPGQGSTFSVEIPAA